MVARLKLRKNAPGLRYFTPEQLSALSGSFEIQMDPGDEVVHLGESPPADTGKRWQKVDCTGAVVGQLKTYQGGEWK